VTAQVAETETLPSSPPQHTPGTARAALAQPAFRRMYFSGFASNIGNWMQTVVLGPYALRLSGNSARFVALLMLAQLGPLLVLSIPGGTLAARIRQRQRYMIWLHVAQIICALYLALLALGDRPNQWLVLLGVLGGGVGNALSAPVWTSVLPELVGKENIGGAVSLGSAQVNASRVIGPVILALVSLVITVTPSAVFTFNAFTFLAMIWAAATISIPPPPPLRPEDPTGWRSLLGGLHETRINPVARRVLGVMFVFSLASLAYVPQFPSISEALLELDSKGRTYLYLFGTWGFGALLGALSMSTVLASVDKRRLPPLLLSGFAAMLVAWSVLRSPSPIAFAVVFVLGFCYFGTTTALNTVLQQHLSSRARPQVMALWFMCFGGTVPLSGLWAGELMDSGIGHRRGAVAVLVIGAVVAAGLAFVSDLRRRVQ
jgi:MFS family permease